MVEMPWHNQKLFSLSSSADFVPCVAVFIIGPGTDFLGHLALFCPYFLKLLLTWPNEGLFLIVHMGG